MPSLALLLTIAALTHQAGALHIGSAAARLGEKASGFIDVPAGMVMGVVTDFFGNTLSEIPAPFAGVVLYVVATPAISQGEPLGMVGHPVEER